MKITKRRNRKSPGFKRMFIYLVAVSALCYCSGMFPRTGEPEADTEAAKRFRIAELLRAEAESEIQLEAWMMAIDMVEKSGWYVEIEEEELELEAWMLNLELLNGPVYYPEIAEEQMDLEDWMFNVCCWDVNELVADK